MIHKIFTTEKQKKYATPLEAQKQIVEQYKDKFVFGISGTFEEEDFNIQSYNLDDVSLTMYGKVPNIFHFIGPTKQRIQTEKSELEKKVNIKFVEL